MMVDCLIERYYTIRQEEAACLRTLENHARSFIREAAFSVIIRAPTRLCSICII